MRPGVTEEVRAISRNSTRTIKAMFKSKTTTGVAMQNQSVHGIFKQDKYQMSCDVRRAVDPDNNDSVP
jgi:hypothetical protein